MDCPLSRRELLRTCGTGFGALALADLLSQAGLLARADERRLVGPLASKSPPFAPRAKRVLHIFANGGPSQVDTFDPKPALRKYAGQVLPVGRTENPERVLNGVKFAVNQATEKVSEKIIASPVKPSPFAFRKCGRSGIEISELFPRLASCVDDLCIIRSMKGDVSDHQGALMLMNCGEVKLPRPSAGSWITYGLGTENRNLPGFVVLSTGFPTYKTQNWRSGFLPSLHQGTHIDPKTALDQMLPHLKNDSLSPEEQRRQLDLVGKLNAGVRDGTQDAEWEARIQSFEVAFGMQAEALDAFDVGKEPKEIRDLYGPGMQARQLLMARRLLERGVRFVQAWTGGGQPWDTHKQNDERHRVLARECDQGLAALLQDLKRRGMLDDTLVVWGGEFGRTPGTDGDGDGRDHNHQGFTMWLAGGGVKGGYVHGATDEFGFKAVESPVHVHDLHATMLHLLGFDHERFTYRYAGRDFRLTDVHGQVIRELLA